jgi:hypothetical protein
VNEVQLVILLGHSPGTESNCNVSLLDVLRRKPCRRKKRAPINVLVGPQPSERESLNRETFRRTERLFFRFEKHES